MRQFLLMRCATELCDSFDPIHIQFLHLERELCVLLLVHNFPSQVLLQCVYVFGDSVGVLLSVAIGLEPEVVGLAENDQVLGGVADLVVRGVLRLVLDFVGQRE
jgi:hypothetical protein